MAQKTKPNFRHKEKAERQEPIVFFQNDHCTLAIMTSQFFTLYEEDDADDHQSNWAL